MSDLPAGFISDEEVTPDGFISDEEMTRTGVELPQKLTGRLLSTMVAGAPGSEMARNQSALKGNAIESAYEAAALPLGALEGRERVGGGYGYSESLLPIPTFTPKEGEPAYVTVGKEIGNIALGIPKFATSPAGITAGPVGVVSPTITAGAFTADILHGLGQQALSTYKNWSTMTPTQKRAAVTQMAGSGVFAGLTGLGTYRGIRNGMRQTPAIPEDKPAIEAPEAPTAIPPAAPPAPPEPPSPAPQSPATVLPPPAAPEAQAPLVPELPPEPTPAVPVAAETPAAVPSTGIEGTTIAGKSLAEWEAVKDASGLPKGNARAELARWLAVPNQPSRILQALSNKKRTREIHAPPLPIEQVKPAEETLAQGKPPVTAATPAGFIPEPLSKSGQSDTPEASAPSGSSPTVQEPTPEVSPIERALADYEEGGTIQTVGDLADHLDQLISEGVVDEDLRHEIDRYREEKQDDLKEYGGRGDSEQYEGDFLAAVKKFVAKDKAAIEKSKRAPLENTPAAPGPSPVPDQPNAPPQPVPPAETPPKAGLSPQESVELNELRLAREKRGGKLGRLNTERIAELEAKEQATGTPPIATAPTTEPPAAPKESVVPPTETEKPSTVVISDPDQLKVGMRIRWTPTDEQAKRLWGTVEGYLYNKSDPKVIGLFPDKGPPAHLWFSRGKIEVLEHSSEKGLDRVREGYEESHRFVQSEEFKNIIEDLHRAFNGFRDWKGKDPGNTYEEYKRSGRTGKNSDDAVRKAVREAKTNGPSPEFRALFGGIEPELANTTPEKVEAFAKSLGMTWIRVTRVANPKETANPSMGPGAAAAAEFEERPPDPAVVGLSAGNPTWNRLVRGFQNFFGGISQLGDRRPLKRDILQWVNAADNLPRMAGQEAGNSLRLRAAVPEQRAITALMQSLKMSGQGLEAEDAARLGNLEFAGDPIGYLRAKQTDLETQAQVFLNKGEKIEAQAAIDMANAMKLARERFNVLRPLAELAKSKFDRQITREQASGIDTEYEQWYVPQRHELDLMPSANRPIILGHSRGSGLGTGFKKGKVFEDYATAIEAGFVPRSLSIADLLEHRVAQGERLITRKSLFDSLSRITDETDGQPVAMKIPRRVITRPDGSVDVQESVPRGYSKQEVIPGYSMAVHNGYSRLMKALTAASQISDSAAVGVLQNIAAVEKHIGLALDTFHASRTLQAEFMLTHRLSLGERQMRGRALVEYSPSDLDQAVSSGAITQEMADWIRTPQAMQVGGRPISLSPRAVVNLGVKSGLNLARFADVMYRDWLRNVPITGEINRWVFDKMTRAAVANSFVSEFQRVARSHPEWDAKRVGLNVARDINVLFGNLQKESIFRNPSLRAINQILFLAPQWVESLARREGRTVLQLGSAANDMAHGRAPRLGSVGRAVGTGLAAYFMATQLTNLITRGQLTFSNPEEGHKLDAWIPGGDKGFFVSPLSVFGEITHDVLRYSSSKPDLHAALSQIAMNKLGNLGRFLAVVASGRDPLSGEKLLGTGRKALVAASQLVPVPIVFSAAAKDAASRVGLAAPPPPGSLQRQITSSAGLKTEPVPSAQNQVYSMADRWKTAQGGKYAADVERRLKEDFGPGDYRGLRMALLHGDNRGALEAYQTLRSGGKTPRTIRTAMEHPHPFTGSNGGEAKFRASLSPQERDTYRQALDERRELARRFRSMLSNRK